MDRAAPRNSRSFALSLRPRYGTLETACFSEMPVTAAHFARSLLLFALVSTLALPALAAAPSTMAVQGALRSASGGPVSDGDYILNFALYEAASGGAAIWQEGPEILPVKGGQFAWVLGSSKALSADLIGGSKALFLGVSVSKEPELPRQPLHTVAWALLASRAESLACSGCIESGHLKPGSVGADRVGFAFAGSKTKSGPANSALDLECTGCVSVSELKLDGDLDLGGQALKAKKVTAGDISAQSVVAGEFVGDGSKLTGLKVPAGTCKEAGEVVAGVQADGSLLCVPGMNAKSLPADGIVQVSNGLLSNRFVEITVSSKMPLVIPDNNPVGVFDELDVPDVGTVKSLTVHVALKNSDISGIEVILFDPTNAQHVLYDKGGKGGAIDGKWPAPDKQIKGDLGAWVGKNAKGKWRLKVIDTVASTGKDDGAITAFEVSIETISSKKIDAKGDLAVYGTLTAHKGVDMGKGEAKLMRLQNSAGAPVKCEPAVLGLVYYDTKTNELKVCNGSDYKAFATATPLGSETKPALSCKAILDAGDAKGDGVYWILHAGKAIKAWCDMAGGGWTLAASWSWGPTKPTQWGKDAINLDNPKPGATYVLPFAEIFTKPAQVRMDYLPNNQSFTYSMAAGAGWTYGSGGARVQVSNGWYLIWGSQGGAAAAGVCVVNGTYHTGYACDGNSSQIAGQGLFNSSAADEFCNCSSQGWKHTSGGCNASVCGATGQVAVWLR